MAATTISFSKVSGVYEASITCTGTFNLHVVTPQDSVLSVYVKGSSNKRDVLMLQTTEGIHRDITGKVWNKVFRLVCNKEPLEATYEIKSDE